MPIFLVPTTVVSKETAQIVGPTGHHVATVLRMRVNDTIRLTDGAGMVWRGRIADIARDRVAVAIDHVEKVPPPACRITLAAALLPQDRWRFLVEKAVELGAQVIQPIITERTVVRQADARKVEKWQAIADGALEQCGTAWRPEVCSPLQWSDALARVPQYDHSFTCSLDALPNHCGAVSTDVQTSLVIYVGPEGGFTAEEMTRAKGEGVAPLSLGPLTLRSETAAIAALAVVQSTYRKESSDENN